MRRCFLHVGTPKSGTTYLQDVLWASRGELCRQGVRLPLRDIDDHFFLTLALRDRLEPGADPARAGRVLDRLRADLARDRSQDVLISHELLAPVTQDRIDEFLGLLRGFEVHVVITARDLVRQIPAEWQQQVKARSTLPYDAFLGRVVRGRAEHFWSVQDVPAVAHRWGRRLPPGQVHIVTVPPAGTPPTELLTRFCAATGLQADGLAQVEARRNSSLGHEHTELLRRVNVVLRDRPPLTRKQHGALMKFWFAEQVLAQQQPRHTLSLPLEHWDWAVRRATEMVACLEAAQYRVHGDLADLVPPPASARPASRPSEADVCAAGVEALATVLAARLRDESGARPGPRPRALPPAAGDREPVTPMRRLRQLVALRR